jgi:MerR family transcriptional regulator, redox-sensitive transcriptional activator SoxR
MEELTIGEVAQQAGLRTSTLRYYESRDLLSPPRRASEGHRRYDSSVIGLLALLRMAGQAGLTLAKMHLLVTGFDASTPASEQWQIITRSKLKEVEAIITHAQKNKRMLERLSHCRCLSLAECLHAYQHGDISPASSPSNEDD